MTANDTYVYSVAKEPDVRRERFKRSDGVSRCLTQREVDRPKPDPQAGQYSPSHESPDASRLSRGTVVVSTLAARPVLELARQPDESIHHSFQNNLALCGGRERGISAHAALAEPAPVVH